MAQRSHTRTRAGHCTGWVDATSIGARLLRVLILTALGSVAASGQALAQRTFTDTIPGTLVNFVMVEVPGKGAIAPFLIGRTEVTWDMYDSFVTGSGAAPDRGGADAVARPTQPYGAPDYGWGHAGYPVISVTRSAAEAFCDWLSALTGNRYRLPTEAEWEHVASLALPEADRPRTGEIAWHSANSDRRTHPVASRPGDALGLYDLFGNAGEWVITEDGANVLRGGSFQDDPGEIGPNGRRVQQPSWSERDPQLPRSRWWLTDAPFAGFRIVRDK